MSSLSIDKNKFLNLLLTSYDKMSNELETINLFTVIRILVAVCEEYSRNEILINSGGISSLIKLCLVDSINHLYKNKKINKGQYSQISKDYTEIGQVRINQAIDEIMRLQNVTCGIGSSGVMKEPTGCVVS